VALAARDGGGVPTIRTTRSREKPEQIADELRALIVSGKLAEGESLGREPDLVERFGVSRPSLREALRILEAEGLITVVRGVLGGVIVHQPNERMTARTAALLLQARNVTLGDVHEARSVIEPAAVRILASSARRKSIEELKALIVEQQAVLDYPEGFGRANARFHERLVALAGNQTLSIVAEMLNEIVARAVTAVSQAKPPRDSLAIRRRGIRSQERLIELIAIGASSDAEAHWRAHMEAVGKVMIGQQAKSVIDLFDHY
jgi:GntR family transcriptional regulator, transcriptional repressor for pyruvate dehydrogenase complex